MRDCIAASPPVALASPPDDVSHGAGHEDTAPLPPSSAPAPPRRRPCPCGSRSLAYPGGANGGGGREAGALGGGGAESGPGWRIHRPRGCAPCLPRAGLALAGVRSGGAPQSIRPLALALALGGLATAAARPAAATPLPHAGSPALGLAPAPAASGQLVPLHGRQLQTAVSTVGELTAALADDSISRIVVAAGTYALSAELEVTRSVVIEAAVAGTVVLDAQASVSSRRRVMLIDPGGSGVVELTGLNITGGYDVRLPTARILQHQYP